MKLVMHEKKKREEKPFRENMSHHCRGKNGTVITADGTSRCFKLFKSAEFYIR